MVDKKLILAVAGSGKTTNLIDKLNLDKRFYLVTYTITSASLIRYRIIKKFGYLPNNIQVFTYFNFLYNFCVKPFLFFKYNLKGIYLENPPEQTNYFKNSDIRKYMSKNGYVYHNRLAKLIEFENLIEDVKLRLEKFCDYFYYDEVQDLGSHDFNFIMELSKSNLNFLFVGDFYQHTYVTSFDRNVNVNLHKDFYKYLKRFEAYDIKIDLKTLSNSWRCSPTICNYITDNLDINIGSHRTDQTKITLIEDKQKLIPILNNNNIIKLVYNNANKRDFKAKNWGECKGEDDFIDTCIIMNTTTYNLYKKDNLKKLAKRTKNKLYVALSRTRGNCYLVNEKLLK
ncbi:viral (superfamily 1) RNA helicase [Kordia sp. SMS9]|uniref:DNA helicase UvrD n=1 Tax=Kordia sp. SMS9 TaxID=2282170 RepID=UPI000E0D5E9C|nr:DNA helicase UvrD [Kordia sp. SMS9]AXG70598.1 viral (superfamily 1) RNA helicase [Kordia sp. SMS9]